MMPGSFTATDTAMKDGHEVAGENYISLRSQFAAAAAWRSSIKLLHVGLCLQYNSPEIMSPVLLV